MNENTVFVSNVGWMEEHVNILICPDEEPIAQSVAAALQQAGHACTVCEGGAAALDEASSGRYDVIITTLHPGDERGQGMSVLRAARQSDPDCQVIAITPRSDPNAAVTAMLAGALYYLQAPINSVELSAMVDRAAEHVALARDHAAMQNQLAERYDFKNIVGNSRPMRKVFRKMRQIAAADATVLIQGETGTGKELIARAIHYSGERRHKRFVPLNCAGLLETILESELFGHEKGAFTGASSARVGMLEYANHGTLFLDEIGDMPLATQTKVLRALEYGEVVRVGSNEAVHVDVRLIAATNQDLRRKMEDGTFRRDLFYRLNVMTINVPPLRQRQGDIPLLLDYFTRQFSERYEKPIQGFTPAVRKLLFRYHWPGNVRELRNCVEHMLVTTTDDVLGEADLPEYLLQQSDELIEEPALASLAGQPLETIERLHIARTLELVDGNRERASDLLGIGERTLYRKIQKYNLR
ncbi:MAG: sigma-54-dependent Fis family transcriptional regulator [Planctomycetes bacterium]|nr:sigma-54-dependent Fis family transcriptional regulator [Planctomycetota bacterium]